MISVTHKGSFKNIESFFKRAPKVDIRSILEKYAKRGVDALSANTPQDTGLTANSWGYDIHQSNGDYTITWTNTNVVSGIPVAILLQYGHATKNGGFVQGVDFINPALKPLFDDLSKDLWEEVKSL